MNIWSTLAVSGISLATIVERQEVDITLPTDGFPTGVTFKVIAGQLPPGLRIFGNKIVGTPFEVSIVTTFTFVVRGTSIYGEISDRTFSITVDGGDVPVWMTPEGLLSVYSNGLTFIIDNSYVDYYLSAIDSDIPTGQELEFFIEDGDGEIPPGLTLHKNGQITGFVEPLPALEVDSETGFYDTALYDSNIYDYGQGPTTGYDTFLYDTFFYDYSMVVRNPRKLNRTYEFIASVSDGINIVKRKFLIFVIGDDFLRADNAIMQAGTGVFTADNTFLRKVYWLTDPNLGIKRANNFVTLPLKIFDPDQYIGPVVFQVEPYVTYIPVSDIVKSGNGPFYITFTTPKLEYIPTVGVLYTVSGNKNNAYNKTCECTAATQNSITLKYLQDPGLYVAGITTVAKHDIVSKLPPGLFIDQTTGELFGLVPYQPAVSTEYTFTVSATKYDLNSISTIEIIFTVVELAPYGQNYIKIVRLSPDDALLIVNQTIRIGNFNYTVLNYVLDGTVHAKLMLSPNLYLDVPKNAVISKKLVKSEIDSNIVVAYRTFTLTVLGEVDSTIKWVSNPDLGTIRANIPSLLHVDAITTVPNAVLSYTLISGSLPNGLSLSTNGSIIGKVRQFANDQGLGIIAFDGSGTTFDKNLNTTFDRVYKFVIKAEDQFHYSAIEQEFTVTVAVPDEVLFSNIYVKPYQKLDKRQAFLEFITDVSIFTPNKIYRPSDPSFGMQTDLKMLIFPGIETTTADLYVTGMSTNIARTQFRLGNPKKALAKQYGSNDVEYEVIYIEVFDKYEHNNTSVSSKIKLPLKSNSPVLVNQTKLNVAEGNLQSAHEKLSNTSVDRFRPVNAPLTVDSKSVKVSGKDMEYVYPSSVTNMQTQLETVKNVNGSTISTENEFLPLWMLTPQDNKTAATGFIKAIPLCYCKPGEGDYILLNIIKSGFDFTTINYSVDRFIVDQTVGNTKLQFLKFNNYKYNI